MSDGDFFCVVAYTIGNMYRNWGLPAYDFVMYAYDTSPEWAAVALHEAEYGASEAAAALEGAYNVSAEWVVQAFHDVGYTAEEVAAALEGVYNVSAEWLGQAFHDVGYAAEEIIDVLGEAVDDIGDWFCGWFWC
jgi:hypothetical protein